MGSTAQYDIMQRIGSMRHSSNSTAAMAVALSHAVLNTLHAGL